MALFGVIYMMEWQPNPFKRWFLANFCMQCVRTCTASVMDNSDIQCAPANRGKMFEPVFRHFLAGIFKIFFRDIIAYTILSKSYFMEIFVKPTILAVASK